MARRSELTGTIPLFRAMSQRKFFGFYFVPAFWSYTLKNACLPFIHDMGYSLLSHSLLFFCPVCYLQSVDASSKTPCNCGSCHPTHPPVLTLAQPSPQNPSNSPLLSLKGRCHLKSPWVSCRSRPVRTVRWRRGIELRGTRIHPTAHTHFAQPVSQSPH